MKFRYLGNSGLRVSEIGFGTWGIGGLTKGSTSYGKTDDATSKSALNAAFEHGINFFDTANVYGDGHSEHLLGSVFRHRRDSVIIATKAGMEDLETDPVFNAVRIRNSVVGSLRRLQSDYIDIIQLHNPTLQDIENNDELLKELEKLRQEGLVRAIGVSLKSPQLGAGLISAIKPDVVQVNLNLLDHRAIDCGLLELAETQNIGVIARTPLCFGFLSGEVDHETKFSSHDHRSKWPKSQILQWSDGASMLRKRLVAPTEQSATVVALRFCLSFPQVTSVIPGMASSGEVEHNVAASKFGPLNSSELNKVFHIYSEYNQ
jgi:aryl-alcohol dehydrogenase-like predicted oxidoreductase